MKREIIISFKEEDRRLVIDFCASDYFKRSGLQLKKAWLKIADIIENKVKEKLVIYPQEDPEATFTENCMPLVLDKFDEVVCTGYLEHEKIIEYALEKIRKIRSDLFGRRLRSFILF